MTMPEIIVYGADWCPLTTNVREHLEHRGIPYEYIDIDEDRDAAKWVAEQNGGKEKKPTIRVGDKVLSVPSNRELDRAIAGE